jgi:hypothetical protein
LKRNIEGIAFRELLLNDDGKHFPLLKKELLPSRTDITIAEENGSSKSQTNTDKFAPMLCETLYQKAKPELEAGKEEEEEKGVNGEEFADMKDPSTSRIGSMENE